MLIITSHLVRYYFNLNSTMIMEHGHLIGYLFWLAGFYALSVNVYKVPCSYNYYFGIWTSHWIWQYKALETKVLFEALSIYCIWMGGNYNHNANPLFPPNVFKLLLLYVGQMISSIQSGQFLVRWSSSELDLVPVVSRLKSSIFSS